MVLVVVGPPAIEGLRLFRVLEAVGAADEVIGGEIDSRCVHPALIPQAFGEPRWWRAGLQRAMPVDPTCGT